MFNFPVEKIISHENKVFYVFFKYLLTGLECVTLVPLWIAKAIAETAVFSLIAMVCVCVSRSIVPDSLRPHGL